MSRIGDALKRAGAADIAEGLLEMPVAAPLPAPQPGSPSPEGPRPEIDVAPTINEPAPVPHINGLEVSPDSRLVLNPDVPAMAIEQYRRLAATLHHVQEDRGVRRVIVSSAVANEGKTLTSTNLALTLSNSYAKRVLLIDADLRRPRVHTVFGLPNGPGLSEALSRRDPNKLAVTKVSDLLSILPAGKATPDPIAGLTSSRMAAILEDAAEHFDWVIMDTPPVGLLSDARLLAAMADIALIVVGAGTTPAAAIQAAIDAMGRDRVLGVVLNRADPSLAAGGDYYYYYNGYYGDRDNASRRGGLFRRLLSRR